MSLTLIPLRSPSATNLTVTCLLLSEEVLGMHDTVQKYYKYELAVPLRLLPLSGAKHRLARDVSRTPAAAH